MRIFLVLFSLLVVSRTAVASEELWALLKGGGQAVLIRHAITTPGVGDPSGMRRGGNLVLVSHGSTIQALTGVSPGTGEMVVLRPQGAGRFSVAGRLEVR